MAQKTLPLSTTVGLIAAIDPDATSIGDHSTGWLNMAEVQMISAMIAVGSLGTNATVDAKIEQAKDDAGTGAKDVAGAAIQQLTKVGGDDDKQAFIELWGEDLDLKEEYTHVRLTVTVGGANSDLAAFVLGAHPRQGAASDNNAASVAEIVTIGTTLP